MTLRRTSRFHHRVLDAGSVLLRTLPAELSHRIVVNLLRSGFFRGHLQHQPPMLDKQMSVSVPGLGTLTHPLGLAAGFDKNCEVADHLAHLGFSFLEIGTVTPLPQPGNPKPRIFRDNENRSIINRLGFNSDGSKVVQDRLTRMKWNHDLVPLGVNIGKNKTTAPSAADDDYLSLVEDFIRLARFIVINVSSPNSEGLRDLASKDFLTLLSERLSTRRHQIWIKLDPDMPRAKFQETIQLIVQLQFRGVVLTNTHKVSHPEAGGLSGHPLALMSTACLEWAWEVHGGKLPMIASGGVLTGHDVFGKLARGASAVEIYTALIFRGPRVVSKLLYELNSEMQLRGFGTVSEVIGSYYA